MDIKQGVSLAPVLTTNNITEGESMRKFIAEYYFPILMVFTIWAAFSFFASAVKSDPRPGTKESNCYKKYPIDYVLYTNLFCEIRRDD